MGKFPDDEWREILEASGFHPSGAREEVWRNPYSDLKVKIDVNRETEEPFYQVIAEDGTLSAEESDTEALKHIIAPRDEEPPQLSPEEAKMKDDELLKSMGIKSGSVRYEKKFAGRPPRFSFSVPMNAAGHVAFQLTKAGMKDFEVTHFEEDGISGFQFPTEPEMHVAEEIVKAEFVDQISARKGQWAMWSETSDPSQIKGERELESQKQYVAAIDDEGNAVEKPTKSYTDVGDDNREAVGKFAAWQARLEGKVAGQWGERSYDSDQVHDVLDAHRRFDGDDEGANLSFDDAVPQEEVEGMLSVLDRAPDTDESVYLGVVVFLVTHGSQVPALYRDRARRIAFELVQDEAYLSEWSNPQLRKVELEHEIELLEGVGKTALYLPDDLKYLNQPTQLQGKGMSDAEVKKMEAYRYKKLLAWIEELGLDLSAELKRWEEGDFWARDAVYEEVRDMIKEERKFQNYYSRTMRGPRPYNRKAQ